MKNIKEKKDQPIEELQERHEKVAELEKIAVRYNLLEKELQQSDEKLAKTDRRYCLYYYENKLK